MRSALMITFSFLAVCALAPVQGGCSGSARSARTAQPMPAGGTFTGVWFSPQYGEMHLEQSGQAVVGRYSKDEREGRIQGQLEGNLLRFEWRESRELIANHPVQTTGHGYFHVVKNEQEDTWNLQGEWGHDDDESGGGAWTAVKSKTMRPDIEGDGADQPSAGGDYSGEDYSGDSDYGSDDSSADDSSGILDNL